MSKALLAKVCRKLSADRHVLICKRRPFDFCTVMSGGRPSTYHTDRRETLSAQIVDETAVTRACRIRMRSRPFPHCDKSCRCPISCAHALLPPRGVTGISSSGCY